MTEYDVDFTDVEQPHTKNLGTMKVWQVPSESRKGKVHIVAVTPDLSDAICSCEGFQYHRTCKHLKEIMGL